MAVRVRPQAPSIYPFNMPNYLRKPVIFILAILAITGVVSTLLETGLLETSKFLKSNIIRFHVSWSVLSCIMIGIVLEGHVKKMLKMGKSSKKNWGILSLIFFTALLLTSFGIRHTRFSNIREIIIVSHWVSGLIAIAVFLIHIMWKKKKLN